MEDGIVAAPVGREALVHVHALEADRVLETLAATRQGLSGVEAEQRRRASGPNELPRPKPPSLASRILAQFEDVLIYVLLIAALIKAAMAQWTDCAVIVAVAVINAAVGLIQEGRAERALAGIRGMLSADATVRRDGSWTTIDAAQAVPGDVVRVAAGDRVPADVRVLEASQLRVDESALTGESVPAEKRPRPVAPNAPLGERSSMLFSGTIVAAGQGTGVVTAIGADTQIGGIQAMVTAQSPRDTPLARELDRLGKHIALAILVMAVIMVAIGSLVHNLPLGHVVSAAIGFAVAAIPEGLPALVTVTLALGVQQIAHRRAITRRLHAVETLGAVSVICSDKTGTLTKNQMTVRELVTTGGPVSVSGLGYDPHGELTRDGRPLALADDPTVLRAVSALALCNDARIERSGQGWRLVGEPTEGAIAALAAKAGFDPSRATRLDVLPFDSAVKYMATLDREGDREEQATIHVKGAPDRLLERCDAELGPDGSPRPLDRTFWEGQMSRLGGEGLRVLAAAARPAGPDTRVLETRDVQEHLVLLGLVGIVDPPRPEAIEAISTCHSAGIRVAMITGDHADTALAISREMGIVGADAPVLTGADIEEMSDAELEGAVRGVNVYARTSPAHKLRIVRAMQAHGDVVAMTGDGVNDAPALARADIGVAMGVNGTEAAKDTADVVLADDNFATIERAVEEGRRIYDNLRKSVVFLLPTNGAQSLVMLVAVLAGWALPLTPTQILWINLVTSITLSLALAYEGAEPGAMRRPPRDASQSLVTGAVLAHVAIVSVLIGAITMGAWSWQSEHEPAASASTFAVTTLALAQAGYLFTCRFLHSSSLNGRALRGNRAVWISVAALVVLQLAFVYAPFMHATFNSAPLDAAQWLAAAVAGVAVAALGDVSKMLTLARR